MPVIQEAEGGDGEWEGGFAGPGLGVVSPRGGRANT
jgi:hypothetical protein